MYIASISRRYFLATKFLFSFKVAVSSPPWTEKSFGSTVHFLIRAALESGHWPLAALVLVSSILALIYVWRVVETAYFKHAPAGRGPVREAPAALLIPTLVLVASTIYFGLNSSWSAGWAERAVGVASALGCLQEAGVDVVALEGAEQIALVDGLAIGLLGLHDAALDQFQQ